MRLKKPKVKVLIFDTSRNEYWLGKGLGYTFDKEQAYRYTKKTSEAIARYNIGLILIPVEQIGKI